MKWLVYIRRQMENKRKESGKMTCSTPNIHRTAAEQTPNEKREKEVNSEQQHNK